MANQNLNFTITAKDLTRGTFRKLNQSLGLVRKALFNFKVGLTAVAGAAGLGLLVKSSMQSIDTLGKTATKLGVTTQALQKLRFAANLAGVETRTVDMAVQRFTRRLSEAANNTGEAKDALKELGLNAKELTKLSLDEQMLKLADAFDDVQASGDKVRLAFKLFDSEGVAFINTLEGGSAALQNMFSDAESLGFILSGSAVRGVEKANDQFTRLGTLFKGVADTVTAALSPALGELAKILTEEISGKLKGAGDDTAVFGRQLAEAIIIGAKNASQAIIEFVNTIITQINAARRTVHDFKKSFGFSISKTEFAKSMDAFNKKFEFWSSKKLSADFAAGMLAIKAALRPLADEANHNAETFSRLAKELEKIGEKNESVNIPIKNLVGLLQRMSEQSKRVTEDFTEIGKVTLNTSSVFDRLLSSLKQTNDQMKKGSEDAPVYRKQLMDLADAAKNVQKNMESAAVRGIRSLEDALVGITTGTASAKDAFRAMASSIVADLTRIAIQKHITGQIAAGMGGAEGGNVFASIGRAFGGFFANGGRPPRNKVSVVGERGAELFVPDGVSGTIVPNGGGGSVTVNQTINLSTGVSQTVRAEVMNMLPQINQAAKAAVIDAKRRGGSFASVFGG
jgi:methyl-accepting chemotaxis protein